MGYANDDTLPCGRRGADEAAVLAALGADELTGQRLLEAFEEDLSIWTADLSCVAVSSAAAALHVAYAAAGLGPGDDVVVSPLSHIATASAAAAQGSRPVFADIDDDTATLDPAAVAAAATSRTRVVTATDYAGHPAEYDDLRAVTDALGAVLVSDAGEAFGATYRGVPLGALADLTALSFAGLDVAGGAVAVADETMLSAARRFRSNGAERGDVHSFGLDYQLAAVLCALGRSRLRTLSARRARRTDLAERYTKLLDDVAGLRRPVRRSWVDPAWSRYPVRVREGRRDEIAERLWSAGIDVHSGELPAYWQPVFAGLGYRRGMCPLAERFWSEQLCLPLDPDLTDADQDHVIDALHAALR